MTQPVIGITTSCIPGPGAIPLIGVYQSYLTSIQAAGGLAVLIPINLTDDELESLLPRLDGSYFPGGGDIDPVLFAGQPHPAVYGIDPDRDRVEIYLTRRAAQTGKPFFGICRGIQVINVALGGSLYTHIAAQHPQALRHDWYPNIPREHLAHAVQVAPASHLAAILGAPSVETNSLHHQGIDHAAPALRATAWAPDGLIEAVELPDHPFGLGVQWHPENLQAYAPMRALFHTFVEAAVKKA